MQSIRKATKQEEKLLEHLIQKSGISVPKNWKDELLVQPMNDGEMGSLYLIPKNTSAVKRQMGRRVSDLQFMDLDGVQVIVSLNVDKNEELYELDIWKTDFGKLLKLPEL